MGLGLKTNNAVLLYRLPQPEPKGKYVLAIQKKIKSYGVFIAPQITTGQTGTGMDVKHYLGLTLMKLGGTNGF